MKELDTEVMKSAFPFSVLSALGALFAVLLASRANLSQEYINNDGPCNQETQNRWYFEVFSPRPKLLLLFLALSALKGGCSALLALLLGNRFVVAGVGDCRVLLLEGEGKAGTTRDLG